MKNEEATQNTGNTLVDQIRKDVLANFGDNLVSILLYGSSVNKVGFFDIDILIILNEKNNVLLDTAKIRTICASHLVSLDLQLIYSEELTAPNYFSLGASGPFFIFILKDARILYGENPFLRLSPNDETVIFSLIHRIQGYVFKARQESMGMERFEKDQNPNYHQKHVQRTILDIALLFEEVDLLSEACEVFNKYLPDSLSKQQQKQLVTHEATGKDHIANYLALYETLYQAALKAKRLLVPDTEEKPKRSELHGLVFEYIIPRDYNEAIIIIDGLPRNPELTSFLNLIASWGYAVFFPRLRGTWESSGTFLDHNPADDIQELVEALSNGLVLDDTEIKVSETTVIGSSFGGLVALYASLLPGVKQVVAMSPVYTMSSVPKIETLGSYINKNFTGAYRHTKEAWEKLIGDRIISFDSLVNLENFDPKRCIIIGGELDEQISIDNLKTLTTKHQIELISLPVSHISFNKNFRRTRPLLNQILARKLQIADNLQK